MKTPSSKKAAEKKSPVAKKAPAKKTVAAKASPAAKKAAAPKASTKVSTSAKKTAAVKAETSAVKKSPAKPKSAPAPKAKKTISAKKAPIQMEAIENSFQAPSTPKEGVKLLGIIHLIANIISGGTLGIILTLGYYLIKKDTISSLEKETAFEIINFNLSFIIYMGISALLVSVIIGVLLVPVVALTWLILLILGFLSHIAGENYQYPFIIRFIG